MGLPTGSGPSPGPSPAPSSGPSPAPSPSPPTPVSASPPTPDESGFSLGPPDASTYALGVALDEPILTDINTGAGQLLSTGIADGLSDPFGVAQGGWISGPQEVNPFTLASGTADPFVSCDVNPYTNAAADDANPNAYVGGQNIEPFGGAQNAAATSDGRDVATAVTGSPILAFGVEASAVDNAGSTWLGYVYDTNGNAIGAQFQDSQGAISYYFFDNPDSPAPVGSAHFFPELDLTEPALPPPGTPPPPDFVPEPTQPTSAPQPAPQVSATPAPTPSPTPPSPPVPSPTPANPAPGEAAPAPQPTLPSDQPTQPPTQQSALPTPTPTPQPPSPAGSGPIPFDPMADSPLAKWLLYGSDTPIRDFLTNDAHLQVAQNVALGVATGAATVATGGILLEAAPTVLAGISASAPSASAAVSAAAPVAAGAGGILATHPELPEEIEEALGPELQTLEANFAQASGRSTLVYRLVDETGETVYYGISKDYRLTTRLGEHAANFLQNFRGLQVISEPLYEQEARLLETNLIQRDQPILNLAESSIRPPVDTLYFPRTIDPTATLLNPLAY